LPLPIQMRTWELRQAARIILKLKKEPPHASFCKRSSVNVRFAPKATEVLRCREASLCARTGCEQSQQNSLSTRSPRRWSRATCPARRLRRSQSSRARKTLRVRHYGWDAPREPQATPRRRVYMTRPFVSFWYCARFKIRLKREHVSRASTRGLKDSR